MQINELNYINNDNGSNKQCNNFLTTQKEISFCKNLIDNGLNETKTTVTTTKQKSQLKWVVKQLVGDKLHE